MYESVICCKRIDSRNIISFSFTFSFYICATDLERYIIYSDFVRLLYIIYEAKSYLRDIKRQIVLQNICHVQLWFSISDLFSNDWDQHECMHRMYNALGNYNQSDKVTDPTWIEDNVDKGKIYNHEPNVIAMFNLKFSWKWYAIELTSYCRNWYNFVKEDVINMTLTNGCLFY